MREKENWGTIYSKDVAKANTTLDYVINAFDDEILYSVSTEMGLADVFFVV